MAPATLTLTVNGKEVSKSVLNGQFHLYTPHGDTFDIGVDFDSPVSLDYFDRAPFKFNGKIEKINIKYID